MSLINQMLKDLESRQNRKSGDKASAINWLNAAPGKNEPKVSKKFLFTIIPVFLVLVYMLYPSASDKEAISIQKKAKEKLAALLTTNGSASDALSSPVSGVATTGAAV